MNFSTAQGITLMFGIISIIYGAHGIFNPIAFASRFGYSGDDSVRKRQQPNGKWRDPFVVATGGRTAALGLALIIFAVQAQLNAAGIVLACCSLSGLSDAVTCYSKGNMLAVLQHAAGTVVLASSGWWLTGQM